MAGHVIPPEFNAGEHTDAAAPIGTAAPAIKSMAEPIYEEPGLVRIQRRRREDAGWPELAGAKLAAAAGARARAVAATEHGEATRGALRHPHGTRSTVRCSGRAVVALATTVTWSAARRSRARRLARLRREFERGNGGETEGSSRRFGGRAQRLGGSSGVDGAAMGIHGGRRRRRRRRRLHGALRLAWLGGELQSEEVELLRVSERRGGDGGCGNGEWRRRQRSGAVRESKGEGEGKNEEVDRIGTALATSPSASRWQGRGQAGWWRGGTGVRARRPHACPTGARTTTTGTGPVGRLATQCQVDRPK